MKIALQQPLAYAGHLPSLSRISQVDLFVVLDIVKFSNQSYQCRQKIRTPSSWMWITIPTRKGPTIAETKIDGTHWKRKHLQTWQTYYGSAPHFDRKQMEALYLPEFKGLAEFNIWTLSWVLHELSIITPIATASDYVELRESEAKGSDLVLGICRHFRADEYHCGSSGKKYLDVEKFGNEGIEVVFDEYQSQEYKQAYSGFEAGMCALDALFCLGAEGTRGLL